MAFLRRGQLRPQVRATFFYSLACAFLDPLIDYRVASLALANGKEGCARVLSSLCRLYSPPCAGIGKTVIEPKHWELNPPKPLPVSDPVTGWTKNSKRVGAIGYKLGMSSTFDSNYELTPVTFLQVMRSTHPLLFFCSFSCTSGALELNV